MISYHYLQNSKSQLYELFTYFSSEEKKKGMNVLKEMGEESVNKWFSENIDEVKKYILSAPSERGKKKKWNTDFKCKFLLVYFAANYIERGIILLQVLEEHPILQNESYREMSLKASDIFTDIHSYKSFYDTFFEEKFDYENAI